MNVKAGNIYKHFKGHIVEVIGVCKHTETMEDLVVYKHLGTGDIWARPIEMFTSKVDKEKYPDVDSEYRFTDITDEYVYSKNR